MSQTGPFGTGRAPNVPTPPVGETIARYGTYLEAQRAVDFLSDRHFPVQAVTIVGTDLRMVERVTGRLTYGRVAGAGAASGIWFGLFVGLLLSLFAQGGPSEVIAAMLIGAAFGMLFGVISYAATGGRRDFTSSSQIVAREYQVLCMAEHARAAMEILGELTRHRVPGGPPAAQPGPYGSAPPSDGAPGGRPAFGAPPPDADVWPGARPKPGPMSDDAPAAPGEHQPGQPVTGPTYSEMIEKQRREQAEREQAERERAQREQAEREG